MVQPGATDKPADKLRDRFAALTGPVWTLVLWCAVTIVAGIAIRGVFGAIDNAVDTTGYLWAVAGAINLVFIAGLLFVGARTPIPVLHAIVVIEAVLVLASAAQSVTNLGVVVSGLGLVWVVLYASFWWSRSIAFGYAVAMSAGFLAVIAFDGSLALLGPAWVLLTLVLLSITAVVSHVVRQLDRQSTVDPLTGLLNRYALDEYVARYATEGRASMPRAVMVIDLDGLTTINDTRGHAAGDAILLRFAAHVRRRLRADDLLFRIGVDEFLVVLPKTPESWVAPLVARMRDQTPIAWSCGWADWPNGGDFDTVLSTANVVMREGATADGGPKAVEKGPTS